MPQDVDEQPQLTHVLLEFLIGAAEAHGIHEKEDLGGVYDTNWPKWYANHMSRALTSAGYTLVSRT